MSPSIEQRLQIIEDRDALAKLQAHYIKLNDGGWSGPTHQHPEAVGDLFVDDGIWDGPPGRAEGRAAIIELFRSFQTIPFIVHYISNPLIEIDGDTAHGEWHSIVTAAMPPERQALWTLGKYINDYVRTPQGWKYCQLRFEAAAITSFEQGWGKQQFVSA